MANMVKTTDLSFEALVDSYLKPVVMPSAAVFVSNEPFFLSHIQQCCAENEKQKPNKQPSKMSVQNTKPCHFVIRMGNIFAFDSSTHLRHPSRLIFEFFSVFLFIRLHILDRIQRFTNFCIIFTSKMPPCNEQRPSFVCIKDCWSCFFLATNLFLFVEKKNETNHKQTNEV